MEAFCQFLVPNSFLCRISTSPNGEYQPGASEVKWVVQQSSGCAAANSASETKQERVADVVVFHAQKEYFAIVVEISDMKDATAKLMEQMIGLFHPNQRVLLGLAVYPTKVAPSEEKLKRWRKA